MRKIHLHPTMFCEGVEGTSSQVPFRIKASNSSDIAFRHLGSFIACRTVRGSGVEGVFTVAVRFIFWRGLVIAFLARVVIGCMFVAGGGAVMEGEEGLFEFGECLDVGEDWVGSIEGGVGGRVVTDGGMGAIIED